MVPARGTPEWEAFVRNARDRYRLRDIDIVEETLRRERDPYVRAAVARNDALWCDAFDGLARDIADVWAEEGHLHGHPVTAPATTTDTTCDRPLELYTDATH